MGVQFLDFLLFFGDLAVGSVGLLLHFDDFVLHRGDYLLTVVEHSLSLTQLEGLGVFWWWWVGMLLIMLGMLGILGILLPLPLTHHCHITIVRILLRHHNNRRHLLHQHPLNFIKHPIVNFLNTTIITFGFPTLCTFRHASRYAASSEQIGLVFLPYSNVTSSNAENLNYTHITWLIFAILQA